MRRCQSTSRSRKCCCQARATADTAYLSAKGSLCSLQHPGITLLKQRHSGSRFSACLEHALRHLPRCQLWQMNILLKMLPIAELFHGDSDLVTADVT